MSCNHHNHHVDHSASGIPDQTKFLDSLPSGHPARNKEKCHELLDMARDFAKKAYASYSNFHVGAAILTRSGERFGGANVESARAEGLICGERNAILSGVVSGMAYQRADVIDLVAVSCVDLPEQASIADGSPCGACRQVIREFSHPDTIVIIDDKKEGVMARIGDLLPEGFMFGGAVPSSGEAAAVSEVENLVTQGAADEVIITALQTLSKNSYAPLTGIREAAMVVNDKGQGFAAVQVDNSSAGLSISALRGAFNRAAIYGGAHKIDKIMVVQESGSKGQPSPLLSMINPGLIDEFGHEGTIVSLVNKQESARFSWGEIRKAICPAGLR